MSGNYVKKNRFEIIFQIINPQRGLLQIEQQEMGSANEIFKHQDKKSKDQAMYNV